MLVSDLYIKRRQNKLFSHKLLKKKQLDIAIQCLIRHFNSKYIHII